MSRSPSKLASFFGLSLALAACAKLVGITDTAVAENAESPDAGTSLGGSGGSSSADVTIVQGGGGGSGAGGGSAGAPGAAGAGGTAAGPVLDAGMVPDAAEALCTDQATRCAVAGRERCSAGAWQADACPLNQPTCEGDGQCVVRGPAMVAVGPFFVDSTEVTVGQYQQFLTAKGSDVSGQSAVCSWNESYYEGPVVMDPSQYPMSYVDWCDASAYCAWAGKHLCGRIGGGPIARADIFDAELSQWFVSCGGGGTHPNVNATCNSTSGALAPVGSFASCEGYYPGVFDMEGNVAEWIDGCEGSSGPTDTCYLMGGGIFDNSGSYCTEVYEGPTNLETRSDTAVSFGFRCCAG
ncbi:MAG: SUMF1/EgtB/PvdO family nonheme iron enzyme [Deltaproteobacteria bacterium]